MAVKITVSRERNLENLTTLFHRKAWPIAEN